MAKEKKIKVWIDMTSDGKFIGCPESDIVVKRKKVYSYWNGVKIPLIPATISYSLPVTKKRK